MKSAPTLLLTGASGIGKSTLIRRIAGQLTGKTIRGFVSDEVKERGVRVGFRIDTFDDVSAILAHVNIDSKYRLGRYGVDTFALEQQVERVMRPDDHVDIFLIDEIGPMECFSQRFKRAMTVLLNSGQTIVATIHARASGFIQEVKDRPDTELWEVTLENRDDLVDRVLDWIRADCDVSKD